MQQSKAKCCRVVYRVGQARDHIALPKSMRCTVTEHAKEHALPLAMQTDASSNININNNMNKNINNIMRQCVLRPHFLP